MRLISPEPSPTFERQASRNSGAASTLPGHLGRVSRPTAASLRRMRGGQCDRRRGQRRIRRQVFLERVDRDARRLLLFGENRRTIAASGEHDRERKREKD